MSEEGPGLQVRLPGNSKMAGLEVRPTDASTERENGVRRQRARASRARRTAAAAIAGLKGFWR
jgi:hypothetical protein